MSLSHFRIYQFLWEDAAIFTRCIIPPLSSGDYKGQMGKIAVIGGSKDFTGAPFYAAEAALKFGADLSSVFCAKSAATPIKSYSPELMVSPFYDDDMIEKATEEETWIDETEISRMAARVTDSLGRLQTLVVGPGLGRNPVVLDAVTRVIEAAKSSNTSLVIDADGLWLIKNNINLLYGYRSCVLTPNKIEFERLVTAVLDGLDGATNGGLANEDRDRGAQVSLSNALRTDLLTTEPAASLGQAHDELIASAIRVRALSVALGGVTVLRKGKHDLVCSGSDVFVVQEKGSPRRSGGLGDILAGSLGTALSWAVKRISEIKGLSSALHSIETDQSFSVPSEVPSISTMEMSSSFDTAIEKEEASTSDATVHASILASVVAKRASAFAFERKGRSSTAPDVLASLGEAFVSAHPEG